MKLRDYLELPAISTTKETYHIERPLSGYGIPFIEDNNEEVDVETIFEKGDGYRGAWIYRLMFKGQPAAIVYEYGRSGHDGDNCFITDKKIFGEMVEYLRHATRDTDFDYRLEEADLDEELYTIYGYDIRKEISPVELKTDLKVGDTIKMDLKMPGESLEMEDFKGCECRILEMDLNSDYRTMEIEAVNLRKKPIWWRPDFQEIERNRNLHATAVPAETKFEIPEKRWDGKDWEENQLKILKREQNEIDHPRIYVSLRDLQEQGIEIAEAQ